MAEAPKPASDEDELWIARGKFQQAIELERAGDFAQALRLLREVGQLKMTPQVRYHIALCLDNLGQLVAAVGSYELALADADTVGQSFRETVEKNVARLRARIPKLQIKRGNRCRGRERRTPERTPARIFFIGSWTVISPTESWAAPRHRLHRRRNALRADGYARRGSKQSGRGRGRNAGVSPLEAVTQRGSMPR